jgi:hypothetical protein
MKIEGCEERSSDTSTLRALPVIISTAFQLLQFI